jgi:hypothetical protein
VVGGLVLGDDDAAVKRLQKAVMQAFGQAKQMAPLPLRVGESPHNGFMRRTPSGKARLDDRVVALGCGDRDAVFFYGAHAATEQDLNLVSGDWPGQWRMALRKTLGRRIAVAASSGGEVSLNRPRGIPEAIAALTLASKKALNNAREMTEPLALGRARLDLPRPRLPLSGKFGLSPALSTLLLGQASHRVEVQVLRSQRLPWFFLPFEPSATLLVEAASKWKAAGQVLLASPFNGDYAGYLVPAKRHGAVGPEQITTWQPRGSAEAFVAFILGIGPAGHEAPGKR